MGCLWSWGSQLHCNLPGGELGILWGAYFVSETPKGIHWWKVSVFPKQNIVEFPLTKNSAFSVVLSIQDKNISEKNEFFSQSWNCISYPALSVFFVGNSHTMQMIAVQRQTLLKLQQNGAHTENVQACAKKHNKHLTRAMLEDFRFINLQVTTWSPLKAFVHVEQKAVEVVSSILGLHLAIKRVHKRSKGQILSLLCECKGLRCNRTAEVYCSWTAWFLWLYFTGLPSMAAHNSFLRAAGERGQC